MREVVCVLAAPGASAGARRKPRGRSAPSKTVLVETKNRVALKAAGPPPWFFVVSVTETRLPGAAVAGAVKAVTARSGPTTTRARRVLLASFVSGKAEASSARARR
jgi:hypothetical protein